MHMKEEYDGRDPASKPDFQMTTVRGTHFHRPFAERRWYSRCLPMQWVHYVEWSG